MLDLSRWFRLNRREFERQFGLPAIDSKEIVVLDGIDLLPEQSSFRIRAMTSTVCYRRSSYRSTPPTAWARLTV